MPVEQIMQIINYCIFASWIYCDQPCIYFSQWKVREISRVMTNVFQYCTLRLIFAGYNASINYIPLKKWHIVNDKLETITKQWKHILRFCSGIHTCPGEPSSTSWQLSSLRVASLPIFGPAHPSPLLPCKHFVLLLAVVPGWWSQNSITGLLSKLSLRMVAPWLGDGIPLPTLWGSGDLCESSVEKWMNWFTYLGVTVTCPWRRVRLSLFCGGSSGTFDMLL